MDTLDKIYMVNKIFELRMLELDKVIVDLLLESEYGNVWISENWDRRKETYLALGDIHAVLILWGLYVK